MPSHALSHSAAPFVSLCSNTFHNGNKLTSTCGQHRAFYEQNSDQTILYIDIRLRVNMMSGGERA